MKETAFPLRALFVLCAFLAVPPLTADVVCQGTSPSGEFTLTVTIEYPDPGTIIVGDEPCPGRIRLRGVAVDSSTSLFDVFFVIDSSGSTFAASGLDIDGDTYVGQGDFLNNDDPGDSVLAAEVAAVRSFVDQVDPDRVRISIIEFSAVIPIPPGRPEEQGRIRTVQSLTGNYALVHAALDDILQRGSVGATDYGGAVYELISEWTANAEPDTRETLAFFISDGKPTFPRYPYDTTEIPDTDWALEATADAAALGIPINTYELGNFDDLSTLQSMADMTGGEFYADLSPEDLINTLENASLVEIDSVLVENVTTGEWESSDPEADGSFWARVDLVEGDNHFRVTATITGGETVEVICETDVHLICLPDLVSTPRPSGGRGVGGIPDVDRSGNTGGQEGDLGAIEGKLDDEARFVDDAEFSQAIAALQFIEAKLDQLTASPAPPQIPDAGCAGRGAAYWAGLCGDGPYPPDVVAGFEDWSAQVDAMLVRGHDTRTCPALLADESAGDCGQALAGYTALLLNRAAGLEAEACPFRIEDPAALSRVAGLKSGTLLDEVSDVGGLVQALDLLLAEGAGGNEAACRLADLLARRANR
jgi:hypothetical protein